MRALLDALRIDRADVLGATQNQVDEGFWEKPYPRANLRAICKEKKGVLPSLPQAQPASLKRRFDTEWGERTEELAGHAEAVIEGYLS